MRRWNLLAAIAAVCIAVASPVAFAQAPEQPKLQIGVGGKSLFYYLPLTMAERQGYFKAEGLDVEVLDFPGGAKALQALLGGSVDVVSGAYEHTISQQAKGQNIEALFQQGLAHAESILEAFDAATARVAEREKAAGFKPPSNPQIYVGPAMADKLKELDRGNSALRSGRTV